MRKVASQSALSTCIAYLLEQGTILKNVCELQILTPCLNHEIIASMHCYSLAEIWAQPRQSVAWQCVACLLSQPPGDCLTVIKSSSSNHICFSKTVVQRP